MLVLYSILILYRGGVGTECAVGYKGKLCAECESEVDGVLYGRSGATECSECLPLGAQVV